MARCVTQIVCAWMHTYTLIAHSFTQHIHTHTHTHTQPPDLWEKQSKGGKTDQTKKIDSRVSNAFLQAGPGLRTKWTVVFRASGLLNWICLKRLVYWIEFDALTAGMILFAGETLWKVTDQMCLAIWCIRTVFLWFTPICCVCHGVRWVKGNGTST